MTLISTAEPAGRWVLALIALSLVFTACRAKPGSAVADAGVSDPSAPPTLAINGHRTDLIFSWLDEKGQYHDTPRVEEVPPQFRKHVLVRDLSLKPEELHVDEYLFVADLTEPTDGGYPYALESRYHFRMPQVSLDDDGGVIEGPLVTVYGTSWCGACAQARKYLKARNLPFADKDIEKDPAAAEELARKAKRAGVSFNGVPVLDVKGHLMEGFDPVAVERALKGS